MHEYLMSVKLLTEHHLEFLSLKGGYTCLTESTRVTMQHYWKSHITTQIFTGSSIHPRIPDHVHCNPVYSVHMMNGLLLWGCKCSLSRPCYNV